MPTSVAKSGTLVSATTLPQMVADALQRPAHKMRHGTVQKMQQRALAATARAKDQHEFAPFDRQADIVQDRLGFAFIGVGDAGKIDQTTGRGCAAFARRCRIALERSFWSDGRIRWRVRANAPSSA